MGLRPGPFLKRVLFALRALFSPGPAARAFFPSGHSASGGELFARPKSSSKTAPSGGPAGPWPHSQPSWGFPHLPPSARVAGHCAKLGTCQQCRLKPPRKICLARNPLGAIRNSLEKYPSLATLLGLSSAAPTSEGRGATCKIWRVSAAAFVANRLLSAGGYIRPLECQLYIAFCQPVN